MELQEVNAKLLAELQEVKDLHKEEREEERVKHAEALEYAEKLWGEELVEIQTELRKVKAELRAGVHAAADAARLHG